MTESTGNESGGALLARIQQLVSERGVDIRCSLTGNALRLEFADGQRILINVDTQTKNVWLAARSGGIEFIHHDGNWHAHDKSELFSKLREIVEQTISSNPLNARAPRAVITPSAVPPSIVYYEAKESHTLRTLLIVFLAAVVGFWAAVQLVKPHAPNPDTSAASAESINQPDPVKHCVGGFPANGNITLFPESGLRVDGPNDPEISIKNEHAHPLLLILSAAHNSIPVLSVLIHARQNVVLHLPAADYGMMFSVGSEWCNPKIGFSDGRLVKLDKPLAVQMDKPIQLTMQTSGAGMEDFQLYVKTANPAADLPPPTFSGDGSMEVRRQDNGHFYLPGSIENVPVTFMVDTGASVTSISGDIARAAGIRNCKEVQFQTANGTATGCIALVPHMTLGNFVLQNITVAVMPNMETNLLGANVLRNFQVSQSDSSMLIGRK